MAVGSRIGIVTILDHDFYYFKYFSFQICHSKTIFKVGWQATIEMYILGQNVLNFKNWSLSSNQYDKNNTAINFLVFTVIFTDNLVRVYIFWHRGNVLSANIIRQRFARLHHDIKPKTFLVAARIFVCLLSMLFGCNMLMKCVWSNEQKTALALKSVLPSPSSVRRVFALRLFPLISC